MQNEHAHLTCMISTYKANKQKRKKLFNFWQPGVKLRYYYYFFFSFFFFVYMSNKNGLYKLYTKIITQKRRTRSSPRHHRHTPTPHANFATGFDERATQRNWLLLSAAAAATSTLSASSFRRQFPTPPQWRDDEIRLPQWQRWNTAPAYYNTIWV